MQSLPQVTEFLALLCDNESKNLKKPQVTEVTHKYILRVCANCWQIM